MFNTFSHLCACVGALTMQLNWFRSRCECVREAIKSTVFNRVHNCSEHIEREKESAQDTRIYVLLVLFQFKLFHSFCIAKEMIYIWEILFLSIFIPICIYFDSQPFVESFLQSFDLLTIINLLAISHQTK